MKRRCHFCRRRRWFWKLRPTALGLWKCKNSNNCAHYMAVGMGDAKARTREERRRWA